jgi:hypothetical protein
MFKKTLMTAAAALTITAGATTISTPDANADVKIHLNFGAGDYYGGSGGYYGAHHYFTRRILVRYWSHRHHRMLRRWIWRTYC